MPPPLPFKDPSLAPPTTGSVPSKPAPLPGKGPGLGSTILAALAGIFGAMVILGKISNWLSSSSSSPSLGTYQCISGHVEHATHYGGSRNCSICGKHMFWRK